MSTADTDATATAQSTTAAAGAPDQEQSKVPSNATSPEQASTASAQVNFLAAATAALLQTPATAANNDCAPNLAQTRAAIDEVDEHIAALLAQRQALVKYAAALKLGEGEGVVSAVREQSLLHHGAALEQKYHLPSALMQDLQRRILRQSYKEVGNLLSGEQNPDPTMVDAAGAAKRGNTAAAAGYATMEVVLVGGRGGMGRFIQRYLESASYNVSIVEPEDYKVDDKGAPVTALAASRAAQRLAHADWCIIAVPIDVTTQVINTVAPLLRPSCILSDITSIKERPLEAMLKAHCGPVLGLHPMFGPDTFSLVKQVVVAVPGRDFSRCEFICEQFKRFGAHVVLCTASEHDEAMRVIQALRHFTTIAYGNFLRTLVPQKAAPAAPAATAAAATATATAAANTPEQGTVVAAAQGEALATGNAFLERLLELSSPIYHLELMMVGRLFAQDPHLYCDIISASQVNLDLIQRYVTCAQQCLNLLLKQDKGEFISEFNETTAFFGPHARDFLQESSAILALVQDTYPVKD